MWNIARNIVTKRQKGVFSRSVTGDVSEKNRPIDPRSKWQRDGGCLVPDVISVADREGSIYDFHLVPGENRRHEEILYYVSFLPFFPLISFFFFFFLFCDTVIRDIPFFSPDFQNVSSNSPLARFSYRGSAAGFARFSRNINLLIARFSITLFIHCFTIL